MLLSTYDKQRLERFLRDPLPALTPHTITTKRALRRELEQIRAQGHATTVDELEEGLAGVSVGIVGESGALLGTINVSGLSQRLDAAARARAVEQLRAVVDELEAAQQQRRSAAA